jgi:hypothetical protein
MPSYFSPELFIKNADTFFASVISGIYPVYNMFYSAEKGGELQK